MPLMGTKFGHKRLRSSRVVDETERDHKELVKDHLRGADPPSAPGVIVCQGSAGTLGVGMARLILNVLGHFEARVTPPGRLLYLPLKKARAILACLALAPRSSRSRQTLTGLLWPEAAEGEARNNFRVTLSSLRTALTAAQL